MGDVIDLASRRHVKSAEESYQEEQDIYFEMRRQELFNGLIIVLDHPALKLIEEVVLNSLLDVYGQEFGLVWGGLLNYYTLHDEDGSNIVFSTELLLRQGIQQDLKDRLFLSLTVREKQDNVIPMGNIRNIEGASSIDMMDKVLEKFVYEWDVEELPGNHIYFAHFVLDCMVEEGFRCYHVVIGEKDSGPMEGTIVFMFENKTHTVEYNFSMKNLYNVLKQDEEYCNNNPLSEGEMS